MYNTTVATNNVSKSSDPYVMETATVIYAQTLFWSVVWEVRYTSFLKFDTYQNALNFDNFLISDLKGEAIYNDIFCYLLFHSCWSSACRNGYSVYLFVDNWSSVNYDRGRSWDNLACFSRKQRQHVVWQSRGNLWLFRSRIRTR